MTVPAGFDYRVREKLLANRTYYVATTGADTNDGLTAGAPFLTIQAAVDAAAMLDLNGYDVTILVAAGTYASAEITCKNAVGNGDIYITGDTTTPSNVVIDASIAKYTTGTYYRLGGLKIIKTTASATEAVIAYWGAQIYLNKILFSTGWTRHIYCAYRGYIQATGNYEVAGNATNHILLGQQGTFVCAGRTITLTGTPAFTAWINATTLALGIMQSNTYSGSATGSRYVVNTNAVLGTAGATLPGDAAGSTATGGVYT